MKSPTGSCTTIKTAAELTEIRASFPATTSVGFVPTMGNLHEGHQSLVKKALAAHDVVFISIFVNPAQFGPSEDFARYPRTLENDEKKIQETLCEFGAEKKVYIFAPQNSQEIYPAGHSTTISVGPITHLFCGKVRPGHFDGVCIVVYLLFQIVRPQVSYFGQKDFQQTLVIKKMVHDLLLPVKIAVLPTSRDSNSLALSSRNQYLSLEEKKQALHLAQTLHSLQKIVQGSSWSSTSSQVQQLITQELQQDSRWEYLAVCSPKNLLPPEPHDKDFVILGAYRLGSTRLIDNILVLS